MRWNELEKIVIALEETYPDEDIEDLRFEDLHDMIITLNEFDGDTERYDERILEAVLDMWIDQHK